MTRTAPASSDPIARLAAIGKEIQFKLAKGDAYIVSVNLLLAEAKQICADHDGTRSGTGFTQFAKFKQTYCPTLGKSQAYKRLAIASGKTTEEAERAKETARKRKQRADVPENNSGTEMEKLSPAQEGARTKKRNRLVYAYADKFPGWGGIITAEVELAMAAALETGIDQPILIEQRRQDAEWVAEHRAKLAAEHAIPFTAKLEKQYTAKIKERRIMEGDCERPWRNYADYRAAHSDVAPLTADDLAYVGQWTGVFKALYAAADAPALVPDKPADAKAAGYHMMLEAEQEDAGTVWLEQIKANLRDDSKVDAAASAKARLQFASACRALLPLMNKADLKAVGIGDDDGSILSDVLQARCDVEGEIARAELEALEAKRIKSEAKNPNKAKAKALDDAQEDAMADDMDSAKEDNKGSGDPWGDLKDDWIADWLSNNWGAPEEAEFEKDFAERWQRDHGAPFPGHRERRAAA